MKYLNWIKKVPLIVGGLLILFALFFLIKRNLGEKRNSRASTEQGSGVVKVKKPYTKTHKLFENEETYIIESGYRAEFSERIGRLYWLTIDGKEVLVGDGIYDEFGNYQLTYTLRKHESANAEDVVIVTLTPLR